MTSSPQPGEPAYSERGDIETGDIEPGDTEPGDIEPGDIEPGDSEPGDSDVTDTLVQTAFVIMGILTRVASDHDVSLTQLRVLGILRDHRPRMSQLAEFLGLDKSTLSGLIERAEQRGLVERTRSTTDGRATEVGMTSAGCALAEQVHARVRDEIAVLTTGFDAVTRAMLVRELGPLAHWDQAG